MGMFKLLILALSGFLALGEVESDIFDSRSPSFCQIAIVGTPATDLVAQTLDYSCGPACLVSVLLLHTSHPPNDVQLGKIIGTSPYFGTLAQQLVYGAKYYGLHASSQGLKNISDLVRYKKYGESVIVLLSESGGHWVVVDRIFGRTLRLMDPWVARRGRYRTMSIREFNSLWYRGTFFGQIVRVSPFETVYGF